LKNNIIVAAVENVEACLFLLNVPVKALAALSQHSDLSLDSRRGKNILGDRRHIVVVGVAVSDEEDLDF